MLKTVLDGILQYSREVKSQKQTKIFHYSRVATDTGITGKYLNILEKIFILKLYLKNPTLLENTGIILTGLTK